MRTILMEMLKFVITIHPAWYKLQCFVQQKWTLNSWWVDDHTSGHLTTSPSASVPPKIDPATEKTGHQWILCTIRVHCNPYGTGYSSPSLIISSLLRTPKEKKESGRKTFPISTRNQRTSSLNTCGNTVNLPPYHVVQLTLTRKKDRFLCHQNRQISWISGWEGCLTQI